MPALSSALLNHVCHGFGAFSETVPASLAGYWERKANLKQVHGNAILELTKSGQDASGHDGFYSRTPGIPVAIMTADCVPILLARKDGKAVAAVHAGWRGTKARILRALWTKLLAEGEKPADWVAAVGPAIGPCCYQVSEELAQEFQHEFNSIAKDIVLPRPRFLNLPAINAHELRAIGLSEVEVLPYCTRCARGAEGEFLFHSYRRDPGTGRQYSGLIIL